MIKKWLKNPAFVTSLALWISIFVLYILGTHKVNPSYADSDEIITIGYLLSVAHPSGFPLQIVLTKLFTLLPIPGSIAFKANLLSAFLHSLTVSLVFGIFWEISRGWKLPNIKDDFRYTSLFKFLIKHRNILFRILVGVTVALMLAFSPIFWLYATVAEVMALHSFLTAFGIYLAFKWRHAFLTKSSDSFYWFVATSVIAGVGISHVQTYLLLLPGFLLILVLTLWETKKIKTIWPFKIMWLIGSIVTGFVIPNLLLFWLNLRESPIGWNFAQNISGWWGHITRRIYQGYVPEDNQVVQAYYSGLNPEKYLNAIFPYFKFINEHFAYVGISLALLGIIWLWYKNKKIQLYILLIFYFFSSFVLAMHIGIPQYDPNDLEHTATLGIIHRQYLFGEVVLSLLIAVGLWAVLEFILISTKKWGRTIIVSFSLFLLSIGWFVYQGHSIGFQQNQTILHDFAKSLLDKAEPNSVIICFSDISCFSMLYLQHAENYRPDVSVLSKNPYLTRSYLKENPDLAGFHYIDNPYFTADLITWNVHKRPTYLADSNGFYTSYVGLEGNPFFLIPKGYLLQVVTEIPNTVDHFDYSLTDELLSLKKSKYDYWLNGMQGYFASFHHTNGVIYTFLGDKDEAKRQYQLALSLKPDYPQTKSFLEALVLYEGNPNYSYGLEASSSAHFFQEGMDRMANATQSSELQEGYKYIQKATFLDPLNRDARLELAKVLRQGGYYVEAEMEYRNILKYYPDDWEVQVLLKEVQGRKN